MIYLVFASINSSTFRLASSSNSLAFFRAVFWLKFEPFSPKIQHHNFFFDCVFASLDARRGRTEAWGFGGKDSVRPHHLFLAAAAPFFRAGVWKKKIQEALRLKCTI
jgi:hypothetical protein